jgi:hypothetical protein
MQRFCLAHVLNVHMDSFGEEQSGDGGREAVTFWIEE